MKAFLPLILLTTLIGCAPPAANPPATPAASNTGTNGTSASDQRNSDDARVFARSELEVATVMLNGKPFRLWIMDTDPKRQEGMMFLREEDVEADQGMLFAFPDVQREGEANGFWMRNTYIPLDIIYISPDRKVVNVGKGVPFNEASVPPEGSYQYVIELKGGTASRIGLNPGDSVELPKNLKPTSDPLPINPGAAGALPNVTR